MATVVHKDKADFLKTYANLLIDVRREIILVMGDQPITWNVAYAEIQKETKLGKEILKKLIELEFI